MGIVQGEEVLTPSQNPMVQALCLPPNENRVGWGTLVRGISRKNQLSEDGPAPG